MVKGVKMKASRIITLLITLTFCFGLLYAETEPAEVVSPGVSPAEILRDSGTWGYIILFVFAVGIILAIVRFIQLYVREKIDAGKFYLKLKGYIKNDQIDEATKITENFKNTTLGFIFWSGLMVFKDARKSGKSGKELREAVQNSFDEAVLQTVHKLDGGLWWFDILAQICTYLGLLGTIWGLIIAFKGLEEAGQSGASQRVLTSGIKIAIGTTAMGLIAAIPLTIIKGGLLTRAQKLIADIDEFCVKLINQLYYTIKD